MSASKGYQSSLSWLELHPSASRGALVHMVQATQDRHRAYRPLARPGLRRYRLGCRLPEALVRARPVEVRAVLPERVAQVALAEDEQVVGTLAAHAAEEPLAHGVGPRRAIGRAHDL